MEEASSRFSWEIFIPPPSTRVKRSREIFISRRGRTEVDENEGEKRRDEWKNGRRGWN